MYKLIKITFFTIIIFFNGLVFAEEDIKGIKGSDGIFHEFMYYQVLIILLLILLYFYNKKINKKDEAIKSLQTNEIENNEMVKKSLIKKIKKLLKSVESLSKTEFYEKLTKYFREYFDLIGIKNTDIMTLKEIKNLDIDKNLILLFEESYLSEFNDKNDTVEKREILINKFIKFIK